MFLQSFIKIRDVIMQCAGIEWSLIRLYTEAISILIRLRPPANICLRTSFLWADIREELFVCRLLIQSDTLRELTVSIAFNRTTTIENRLIHVIRQLHQHAITKHVRCLAALLQIHFHADMQCSISRYSIYKVQFCANTRHVINSSKPIHLLLNHK